MKTSLRLFAAFALVGVFLCPPAARAELAAPVNMAEMVGRADTIFRGICTAATPGKMGALDIMTYQFTVLELVKGNAATPFAFSQVLFKGVPEYEIGRESWLFLTAAGSLGKPNPPPGGLRSTVGMEQGKFMVIQREGKSQVVNGRDNAGLFRGAKTQGLSKAMSAGGVSPETAGPIDQDAFKRMVESLK